ncbi:MULTISPECIES: MgtC/SapB family protein [unclassified Clostridium]|uniref:MgtC/SapB family protein n=1 Tax=unclassified Clostridium TaxID=2614128 RepID=UPI002A813BB3|nr:MgtC/SapB family protein [Clostridium sp.]MDY4251290.1 MgtC/SapB family protein [Clostridium sp.]
MKLTINQIIIRILMALIIGGLIGYERELQNRAAGLRTHILVCLGATIISLLQIEMSNKAIEIIYSNEKLYEVIKIDYGRLGAQVITGVGFIGAGAIIHNRGNIKGLTTAATLWVVACLGLTIGMGGYFISIFSTIIIFIILVFLKRIEDKFISKNTMEKIKLEYFKEGEIESEIEQFLERKKIKIKKIEYNYNNDNGNKVYALYIIIKPKKVRIEKVLEELKEKFKIIKVSIINK